MSRLSFLGGLKPIYCCKHVAMNILAQRSFTISKIFNWIQTYTNMRGEWSGELIIFNIFNFSNPVVSLCTSWYSQMSGNNFSGLFNQSDWKVLWHVGIIMTYEIERYKWYLFILEGWDTGDQRSKRKMLVWRFLSVSNNH